MDFKLLICCSFALLVTVLATHPAQDVDASLIGDNFKKLAGPTCSQAGYEDHVISVRKMITSTMQSLGYKILDFGGPFKNIIATRGDTVESKYFSFSAHYRPRCPINSADNPTDIVDDGSGVAGALEAARVLAPHLSDGSLPVSPIFLFFDDSCGTVFPNASRYFVEHSPISGAIVGGVHFDEISNYDDTENTSGWSKSLSLLFPSSGLRESRNKYRANWVAGFGPKELNAASLSFYETAKKFVPSLNFYDLTTYLPASIECSPHSPLNKFCLSDTSSFWSLYKDGDGKRALPVLELTDMSPLRNTTKGPSPSFAADCVKASLYYFTETQ